MTLYYDVWVEEWPNPIPEGWVYAGTDDEFGVLDRFMVPVDVEELVLDLGDCVIHGAWGTGCDFDYDEARKLLTENGENNA